MGVFFQNARRATNHRAEPWHLTPQLDRMAAEGVQLRQHYCPAPVCAPSRASLLLGVHQGHANVRDNQFDKALENNHTLATVLKGAGYATACIGKWGLQGSNNTASPNRWPAHPLRRGFDSYFGYLSHKAGHWHYPKEDGQALLDDLKPASSGTRADLALHLPGNADSVLFTGYLEAPANGEYTFHLAANSGALFRLHEATVIDADFGHTDGSEVSGAIRLQAGRHPFRLYYHRGSAAAPVLKLQWSSQASPKQDVAASALFHDPSPVHTRTPRK